MTQKDDRIYFNNFKKDVTNLFNERLSQLERELGYDNATSLAHKINKLETYACSLYGNYDKNLLRRSRLDVTGKDIVYSIASILCDHTNYYGREISEYYSKATSMISLAKKEHKDKNEKIPHHKTYLENYKVLEKYFLEELKNNNYGETEIC